MQSSKAVYRVCLALAWVPVFASRATAQAPSCGPQVSRWTERCGTATQQAVVARHCADGVVVLSVGPSGARVELREHGQGSFAIIEGIGIAPVGRFNDWALAPPAAHLAFETARACVEHERPFHDWPARRRSASTHAAIPTHPGSHAGETSSRSAPQTAHPAQPARPIPWALFGALGLLVTLLMRNRRRLKAACLGRPALLLGGLFFLPFLARHLLPLAFFHQNGQGPLWLELALCRPTSDYGPGYSKLFGALASFGAADPEPQVVLAIGALMATVPPAAYLIARQVGAGPRIAGIVAAAAAVDPLSARLARSESYYAVICPLLVLATCAALAGARSRRRGDLTLGAAAAGLLVAVSAQVHPLSWLPSALVTAPVLVAGGFGVGHLGTRRAVTRFLATTVIVGAIAAILSLPSMLAVIRGPLGARWLSPAGESTREAGVVVPLVVALLVVASAKDRRRALVRGGAVFFSGLAYAITRSTYRGSVAIGGAHDRLYLGVAIALGAGVIAAAKWPVGLTKPRIAALLTIPIGLWMALRAPDWVRLPTDAQEQALVRRWRARWTGEDRLVFLSRAGERRVLLLPLYSCVEEHPRILPLSTDDLASAAVPGGSHYLHSSLCSTDEGEAACTAFERVMAREPLEHRTLPARASIPGLEYRGGRVEVRLSRLLHER